MDTDTDGNGEEGGRVCEGRGNGGAGVVGGRGSRGGGGSVRGFWQKFTELVSQLRSLQLLHFFADSAVAEVVHCKVESQQIQSPHTSLFNPSLPSPSPTPPYPLPFHPLPTLSLFNPFPTLSLFNPSLPCSSSTPPYSPSLSSTFCYLLPSLGEGTCEWPVCPGV